ncbi:MAG: gluconokinase, GntK/IdnK-type [Candidatus Thiodiazotropha endolucinida]
MIIILMGVSGSGKTTIGKHLAQRLEWRFIEGDDYHPVKNREKMSAGIPLDDEDRQPWLDALEKEITQTIESGDDAILASSALKDRYREQLRVDPEQVRLVYLCGSYELILERLKQRIGHFMKPEMLRSQFDDLERPANTLVIDIHQAPETIVDQIIDRLTLPATRLLLDGLMFPEAPRWRDGWLWFTDQHARRIVRVTPDGKSETVAELDDLPGGLGWLPDGRLLVVSMTKQHLLVLEEGRLRLYADLSELASFHCNDMLIDAWGRCYVGNFGYDLHGGAGQHPAELILVNPHGEASIVAEEMIFPNGCVLSADGSTLLVAETFASRITAFDVKANGDLSNRRIWAELGGAYPDGICLGNGGLLWVAAPNQSRLILVREGGEILRSIKPLGSPYACTLGGNNEELLFITSSETDEPESAKQQKSGRIEVMEIHP